MLHRIVASLGHSPSFYTATLAPQAAEALAAEHDNPVHWAGMGRRRAGRGGHAKCADSAVNRIFGVPLVPIEIGVAGSGRIG